MTKSHKNRPPIAKITPRERNFNSSLKSLCWRLNPQTNEASRKGWYRAGRGIVSRARGVLSSFLFFFFFALVLTPRRDKEEKKAGDGGLENAWQSLYHRLQPFSHPSTPSGGEGKTESTHTHTHIHGVCSIYSKASRALARCTKRKLSCRPEINYRVSRGWIRKGWFLCCNNALRAANLRKYHLDSFGFGLPERVLPTLPDLQCYPFFGYVSVCLCFLVDGVWRWLKRETRDRWIFLFVSVVWMMVVYD